MSARVGRCLPARVDKLTDDEIDKVLDRYRTLLNELDHADIDTIRTYERYLASKIRLLEGEYERRRGLL
jgi:hypothetical protein